MSLATRQAILMLSMVNGSIKLIADEPTQVTDELYSVIGFTR